MSGIVDLVGSIISSELNKPELVCKGLFRFAVRDDNLLDKLENNSLNFEEVKYVINNGLRRKVEKLRIQDVDKKIKRILKNVTMRQAFFTMTK